MSCKESLIYERNFFLFWKKNFFQFLENCFFLDFYKFNHPSILIAEANTTKWKYDSAKALAFVDCQGETDLLIKNEI